MKLELHWMQNPDGETVSVDVSQIEALKTLGYELCDAPAPPEPEVPEEVVAKLKPGQIFLWKDGEYCICDPAQESALLSAGWSRDNGAVEESSTESEDEDEDEDAEPDDNGSQSNGGEQQQGNAVDQEQRRGEDGLDGGE